MNPLCTVKEQSKQSKNPSHINEEGSRCSQAISAGEYMPEFDHFVELTVFEFNVFEVTCTDLIHSIITIFMNVLFIFNIFFLKIRVSKYK